MTKSRNQTSLGLALKLHQKHCSSELLRTLHSHGLISPYDEVLRFKKSAAVFSTNNKQYLNNMLGFTRELGPISAWCGNLDMFVFSPNGRRSTHVMVSEFNQHLSSEGTIEQRADVGVMNVNIPRLRKSEAASLRLSQPSATIKHYVGPKKLQPPNFAPVNPSPGDIQKLTSSIEMSHQKDAAWWSQLVDADPIEWSGWNAMQNRSNQVVAKPKTLYLFGPVIDSPPSHPDTVLTTMLFCQNSLRELGMTWVHLDLDMQLYAIVCMVKWNNPDGWKQMILKPGMSTLLCH